MKKTTKKKKTPKLSIITVNWNGLNYLKMCVDAIKKHTKDYELIIVDNASEEEGTKEYLNIVEKEGVKVIREEYNSGWVGGINEGLKHVTGEFVCFMNNDIEVTENWFDNMEKHFEDPDGKKVGMVAPTSNFTMGLQKVELNNQIEGNHHLVNYLIGWLMLTKRSVLEEVAKHDCDKNLKPVNEMAALDPIFGIGSSDDLDLSLRVRKAGYELFIAREVFVQHHGSKSFEMMFGKDLYKQGTEANRKYMQDVQQKLAILKNKWGEAEVNELLKTEQIKQKFRGTIAVPHGDYIPHRFHTDLLRLKDIKNIKMTHTYGSLVSKARNDMAKAIDGEFLIFIDSDMSFSPESVSRLIKHAEREDVDIVSGLCFRKVPKYEPCFFWKTPDHTPGYYQRFDWPKELFEVDAVGSAFVLIKKKVFEAIPFPWYEYTNFLSEDLNFCRKAKENGFKIWVDPDLRIGHLTLLPVDEGVFRGFNAKKIAEYNAQKKALGGKCPIDNEYKKRIGMM